MTIYQELALKTPCLLACETAQPKYAHLIQGNGSCVLTVNSGYE